MRTLRGSLVLTFEPGLLDLTDLLLHDPVAFQITVEGGQRVGGIASPSGVRKISRPASTVLSFGLKLHAQLLSPTGQELGESQSQ
jgi:hypothetical protein